MAAEPRHEKHRHRPERISRAAAGSLASTKEGYLRSASGPHVEQRQSPRSRPDTVDARTLRPGR
jgi:hypothetical protein